MERELQEEIMMRRDKEVRDIREERLFQVRKILLIRHPAQRALGTPKERDQEVRDIKEERLFQFRGPFVKYRVIRRSGTSGIGDSSID